MSKRLATSLLLAGGVLAAGCGVLEPSLPQAQPSTPVQWPIPPATVPAVATAPATDAPAAEIGWRDFFVDPRLRQVIALALENNRDLRVAVLNVQRAQGLYRVQRADRVPSVGANGTWSRTGGDGPLSDTYTATVGITDFELDLFGRVRNLSDAALQRYFAQEEARRSAQLALIAETATAYLTLAADQEQLRVVQDTLRTREESHQLTEKRYELGAVSALDLSQSRTQVEAARAAPMLALAARSWCSASITSGRRSSTSEGTPAGSGARPVSESPKAVGSRSWGTGAPTSSCSAFDACATWPA
jgi:multidrug efflux system outer membrane protein